MEFLKQFFNHMALHDQRFDSGLFERMELIQPLCGGRLSLIKIETAREGRGATISCKCEKCEKEITSKTIQTVKCPDGIERSEIGTRIALASFTSGSTPTQTNRLLNIIGLPHYSTATLDEINTLICTRIKM